MYVSEECILAFRAVNSSKYPNNCCVFKFENEKLVIDQLSNEFNIDWENFVSKLPENECRYLFYTFKYISQVDNVERSKLIHILWTPKTADKKDKMMGAFFNEIVLDKLGAASAVICRLQASHSSNLAYNDILEKVSLKLTVK